jgi:hypothetical protein
MPAYSFHLCTYETSRAIKDCNSEFPDIGAAMAEANRIGWGMIRKHVRRKPCQLRARLDVRDESNAPVARILFSDLARRFS